MNRKVIYVLIFFLSLNALLWIITAVRFIAYPYSLDFGEGILLVQSSMLAHGENIYSSITEYPYIVSNYHPLYMLLAGIPFHFVDPGLWSGRLITFISASGCMFIVGYLVYKSTKRVESGVLSALLPLCLYYPYNWAFVFRVDYLGIFLSLLGLYFYMYPPKRGGVYISVIPFFLAFMTKLNFVLAPIACLIDLFWKKDSAKWKYLLLVLAGFIIPYFAINVANGFGMFNHTVIYTANEFHLDRMIGGFKEIFENTILLWLPVFIGGAFSKGRYKLLIISYLLIALLSLITFGAEGSDSNYFIEYIFLLSMAAMIWFPEPDEFKLKTDRMNQYQWLILVPLLMFAVVGRIMKSDEFILARNMKSSTEAGKRIDTFVANCTGEVISEDLTFIARNNREIMFQPYIMSLLARKGKWDQSQFVADLENKRFKLLVLRFDVNNPYHSDRSGLYAEAGFDRFTVEMETAVRDNYDVYNPIRIMKKDWYLYVPKPERADQKKP